MTNPVVHAIILGAAILIPGGLLVYFAYRTYRARKQRIQPRRQPTLEELRQAFFQKYPKDSLRARSRRDQLDRFKLIKTRPRKKRQ